MTEDEQDLEDEISQLERELGFEIDRDTYYYDNDPDPVPFFDRPNTYISKQIDLFRNKEIDSPSRPRGILSNTDRQYLFGKKDYAHAQSDANRRQEIRDRVKSSIKDFKILWSLLDKSDQDQIFSSLDQKEIDESIEAIITFFYLGLEKDTSRLERAIERGILAAEIVSSDSSESKTKRIDVSIDIDYYPDIDDIKKKLKTDPIDVLTVEELGVLANSGELDAEYLDALNDEHFHFPRGYFGDADLHSVADIDDMDDVPDVPDIYKNTEYDE